MPLHPKAPSSLASFESRLVLPFWYQLTRVVLENRLLNGCSSSSKTFVTNCASCRNSKSQHTAIFNDCNMWFKRVTITSSYLHHLLPCHRTHSLPGCVRAETGSDDCAGFCWCWGVSDVSQIRTWPVTCTYATLLETHFHTHSACLTHLTLSNGTSGSVAEWLACWTQAQKGPGSNRSRDDVG